MDSSESFYGTTSNSGTFSINVTSINEPGWDNDPVVRMVATAPDVGDYTVGDSIALVGQSLDINDPYFYGNWSGGNWYQTSVYRDGYNTDKAALFHWNQEIKRLASWWGGEGFGSAYTPFRAGLSWLDNDALYFASSGAGLVLFGSSCKWAPKWPMAHEFGHHFQYVLQGNTLGGGGEHWYCGDYGGTVGFTEGFADWHATRWHGTDGNGSIPYASGELGPCQEQGWNVEGNVAAFLWDMFDDVNSSAYDNSIDHWTESLDSLKSWGASYQSFDAFYSDYMIRGLIHNASVANQLRVINGVDTAN